MDCARKSWSLLIAALLASAALLGAASALKFAELAPIMRIWVALIPLPFYIALFIVAVRETRRLDELKQRIQLEALAFAMVGMLLATLCYGMLLKADVGVPNLGWGGVWGITSIFYITGNLLAWRRYR